jgi:surface antigen
MNGLESAGEDRKAGKSPSRINGWAFSLSLLLSTSLGGQAALASTRHHHHIATHRRHHVTETYASETHHHTARLASSPEHHRLRGEHIYYASEHYRYSHQRHEQYLHYASYHRYRGLHYRYASAEYRHSYLQCVPYAREISHIDLTGDAFLWWAEAAGRYARGDAPQEGAVLNFRAIGRMPLGHVAVVTDVIDSRTILTTQANWIRGTITNDVTMQDVSPNNDWSEVEVELGDSSKWGAPYPTYGFIYNQPDNGSVIATAAQGNEVAEAPRAVPIETDAPDRELQ